MTSTHSTTAWGVCIGLGKTYETLMWIGSKTLAEQEVVKYRNEGRAAVLVRRETTMTTEIFDT